MTLNRPLYFVFSERHSAFGSTVMRGQQLSEMVKRHFTDLDVYYTSKTDFRNAIAFITKSFFVGENEERLAQIKANGNLILADIVDSKLSRLHLDYADIIVCASHAGYDAAVQEATGHPVMRLTHHVDPRIASGNTATTFSPGYFGEPANAFLSDAITSKLRVHHVTTRRQKPRWIRFLPGYNFHYAVRTGKRPDGAKPFTKGFTAARCKANILVQRNEGDALHYLGEDYPYLLPDVWTEDDIVAMLTKAADDYGGPVWNEGLAQMAEMAALSSDAEIMKEFASILKAL